VLPGRLLPQDSEAEEIVRSVACGSDGIREGCEDARALCASLLLF
jgi:hypothetical protein